MRKSDKSKNSTSRRSPLFLRAVVTFTLLGFGLAARSESLYAKRKGQEANPNDPSLRLFQLLDTSYRGKLVDFYLLADIYKDPNNPGQELQRVLRLEYDKDRAFGKLRIYVRSVAKLTPQQLKTYNAKEVYDFGVADSEKFVKTEPGQLGAPGDLYLRATGDRPLATSPITDDIQKTYERIITDFLFPALQKK